MIDVQVADTGLNINVTIEGSGPPGKPGNDGISPTVDVSETENGHTVTITDKDGAKSFEVTNGHDGTDGTDGKSPYVGENGHWFEWQDGEYVDTGKVAEGRDGNDGISPTVEVTQTVTGHKVVITDKDGKKSFDVNNGQNGEDGEDGVSPTIAVEDVDGGHRVIITGAAGPKEFIVLNGKNGDPGDPGENGQTPSITIGTVETLPAGSEATAEIIGQTPNLTMNLGIPQGPEGPAGSGASGGLQVADYEHQGNQEIHFSSIDWATGVCDCTEPHNLTEPKKVLIVPNNWWDGTNYVGAGVVHIPIEWIVYTGNSIYVVPVDETRVKITGADKTTIIPVDTEDVSNTNLDATKFHVEIPIGFIISNLPVNVQTLRIFAFGFSGLMTYRYVQVLTDTKSGFTPRRVWPTTMLSVPRTGLSKCGYALPFWYDITVEAAANGTYFDISTLYLGQRQGYSSWIADKTKEDLSSPYAPASDNNAKYFTGIEIASQYACYANHTIFRLYAKAVKE